MKNHAKAGFKNTSHDQAAYGESTDSPPLFRVSIQREFAGDLVGSSTAELLTCQISQERFSYVGTDRFTGKLRDRSGSFVFQHGGKHENGSLRTVRIYRARLCHWRAARAIRRGQDFSHRHGRTLGRAGVRFSVVRMGKRWIARSMQWAT